jgi:hypothetical protein
MADYSPHVLARARKRVSGYPELVERLELDFRNPMSGHAGLFATEARGAGFGAVGA